MNEAEHEMVDILKDIRRWVKILGLEVAHSKAHSAISDEDEDTEKDNKIIFHLSDGEMSSRDIAKYVSVSYRTVANRQTRWALDGLMEKPNPNESYRKLITLEEAGIGVPDIPEIETNNDS